MEIIPVRCEICLLEWTLEEDIYIEQPQGFQVLGNEDKVQAAQSFLQVQQNGHIPTAARDNRKRK